MSLIGEATFLASSPARSKVFVGGRLPRQPLAGLGGEERRRGNGRQADPGLFDRRPVGAQLDPRSRAATAMSISFRGMKRSYAEPLKGTGGGNDDRRQDLAFLKHIPARSGAE